MLSHFWKLKLFLGLLAAIGVALAGMDTVRAADHGDTPLLKSLMRHDTRLAGSFAFVRDGNLVIAVTSDPMILPAVTESKFVFPTDVEFRIAIDNNSKVTFDDPNELAEFGGTIVKPNKIKEDIFFTITFNDDNEPKLHSNRPELVFSAMLFTGLRDDPFIRKPRIGRNIAAIVLELPLATVLNGQPTLLVWATAKAPGINGPFQDLAGRALRSMFMENDAMNTLHPRKHFQNLGVTPDVIIFNTSLPAAFPNGRELTDDVVDLVGDPGVLANDGPPFPKKNDVPFLDVFPYLAPPHEP